MKYLILLFAVFSFTSPSSFDKDAYEVFNKKGKKAEYKDILKAAKNADVILFGELHDNPIAHWLEFEITKDLAKESNGKIIQGAEMFESDNQLLIDEYLGGVIKQKNFEKEVKLWPNYKTDYKPLLEFAKENKTNFIATNIPRRYAAMVYGKGISSLEDLSDEAKGYLPPLPIEVDLELPGYKALLDMGEHANENFPYAQAVKDATMGYFISENLQEDGHFIHYNGSYHSDNFEAISWYVKKYKPETKIMTISVVLQEDISSLDDESKGKADFIICVPESMTRTY